jgi:3-oxoacyl-[acyl-carrier-protein] synthase-3
MYKNILVVASEKHSFGLDFSTRGRNVTCHIRRRSWRCGFSTSRSSSSSGILSTHLHSDGNNAEILAMFNPGTHANHWVKDKNWPTLMMQK